MKHLTYANVMATIAIFGVLAGGGAYAASQIGSKDIKRNAVRAKHIKKEQVKTKHVAGGAIRGAKLRDGAVTAAKLAAGVAISGPQGPLGPAGPAGPKGDPGASGFAADCNEGRAANDVMVRVGSVCIDRYEASLWDAPQGGSLIPNSQPVPCSTSGQNCTSIYARSVSGVQPRSNITWFQAQQALANSGKRLPTNAEWQMAVAGTPDVPGPCGPRLGTTGTVAGCVSVHGTYDMVGNLWEWVADWHQLADGCGHWGSLSDDYMCLHGALVPAESPAALVRGGSGDSLDGAGPFAVEGDHPPHSLDGAIGFRGAR